MTMPTDEELLRRAVMNARSPHWRRSTEHTRWSAVMDTFALGSTYAREICKRHGVDPDEMVSR